MRIFFFGNNSPAKIRLVQTIDHLLKNLLLPASTTRTVAEYKEIPLSSSAEIFRRELDRRLVVLDISSRNNEVAMNYAAEILSSSTVETKTPEQKIILFSTNLLTNANLEFLLSICQQVRRSGGTMVAVYILTTEKRTSVGEEKSYLRNFAGLNKELVQQFDHLVPRENQKFFSFPKFIAGDPVGPEEKQFSAAIKISLTKSMLLPELCSWFALDTYPSATSPDLAPTPTVLREISTSSSREKLSALVHRYLENICEDEEPSTSIGTEDTKSAMTRHAGLVTELTRDLSREELSELTPQLEYARNVAQDFLDPARSLQTLSEDVDQLCTTVGGAARSDRNLFLQVQALQATGVVLKTSFDLLQTGIRESHQRTLSLTTSTTGVYRETTEKIILLKEERERRARAQRKCALFQTVALTIGLGLTGYGLLVAYQAGGMTAVTSSMAKQVVTSVVGSSLPAPLSIPVNYLIGQGMDLAATTGFVPGSEVGSKFNLSLIPTVKDSIDQAAVLPSFVTPLSAPTKALKCGVGGYWEAFWDGFERNKEHAQLAFDAANSSHKSWQIDQIGENAMKSTFTMWGPRVVDGWGAVNQRISDCK